jgi:hypothetical protein
MNQWDSITIQAPELTKTISKLEQDVINLQASMTTAQADMLALRAQVAHEMAVSQLLRTYIEYLNPPDGERPTRPMSYADWLKLQAVNEQILAARAAA